MHTTVMRFIDHGLPAPSIPSAEASGLRLYAADEVEIPAGGYAAVKTGFAWSIPPGNTGLTVSVYDLLTKGLVTMPFAIPAAMTLDERNELSVVLHNMTQEPVVLEKGAEVGQVMVLPVHSMRGVREINNPDMLKAPAKKSVTRVQAYIDAKEKAESEQKTRDTKPAKNSRSRNTGGRGGNGRRGKK